MWAVCAGLVVVTLVAYAQIPDLGFLRYDDNIYVTYNAHVTGGLTLANVRWAFTTGHASNWHPLTWLSHMVDVTIFGLDPRYHHLVSLALHIGNTLLVFLLLVAMTGYLWRSAFVAAVFAVHPLHVESVAWIAERKDVLSTLFWMLTLAAYLGYVRRPSAARYVLVAAVFALGLMAKPMLVTLPIVLLILDYWPLGRFAEGLGLRRLVVEKLPLLGLSAASCAATLIAQSATGTVGTFEKFPLALRMGNAATAYFGYIGKTIIPSNLAPFYPYPRHGIPVMQVAVAAFALVIATWWAIGAARRAPYALAGWLWYLVTLIPVIGLVQVGGQAMADRYTYVPTIGIYIIVAWLVGDWLAQPARDGAGAPTGRRRLAVSVAAGAAILALAACTYGYVGCWGNDIALFEHALRVTKDNEVAEYNLACTLAQKGDLDGAMVHVREAVRIDPEFGAAQNSLGVGLLSLGRTDEAITHLRAAVRSDPRRSEGWSNLGAALLKKGEVDEAIKALSHALKIDPGNEDARTNLATAKLSRPGSQ